MNSVMTVSCAWRISFRAHDQFDRATEPTVAKQSPVVDSVMIWPRDNQASGRSSTYINELLVLVRDVILVVNKKPTPTRSVAPTEIFAISLSSSLRLTSQKANLETLVKRCLWLFSGRDNDCSGYSSPEPSAANRCL